MLNHPENNFTIKFWCGSVLFSILFWIMGLHLLIFHLLTLIIFFQAIYQRIRSSEGVYVPSTVLFVVLFLVFYVCSIFLNSSNFEGARVVSAFYNLSFWCMGALLIISLSNVFTIQSLPKVLKTFYFAGWISALFVCFVLIGKFSGTKSFVIVSPIQTLIPESVMTDLVRHSLVIRMYFLDWFASCFRLRLNFLAPYPTAAGMIFSIQIVMLYLYGKVFQATRKLSFILVFILNLVALGMTLSRMSIFAFLVGGAIIFLVRRKFFLIWFVTLILLLVLFQPAIEYIMSWMLGLREGSTSSRLFLYEMTLHQLSGSEWILGKGIKSRMYEFALPLGSHSTYVSVLFKTGIFGLLAFLGFQIHLFVKWYRLRAKVWGERDQFFWWQAFGWVFISVNFWMMTGDIDAPQYLAFIYFSLIGFFEGFYRRIFYGRIKQ